MWTIAAGALFTVMAALIKAVGSTIHIAEVLFFRQLFMAVCILPAVAHNVPQVFRTARLDLQAVRIVLALLSMLMSFEAFVCLPIAESLTIGFSQTFFITIAAILILGETVGIRRWAAVLVGFAGVLLVIQPQGNGAVSWCGLLAIGGAACGGCVLVIIRKLAQWDRPITIMSYQAVGVGVLMLLPAIWVWKPPNTYEWTLLASIGAVSALMQFTSILAFRSAEASSIAPLDYMRLVFAIGIGFFVFGEWPDIHVFIGGAVVSAAGLYSIHREERVARSKPRRISGAGESEHR